MVKGLTEVSVLRSDIEPMSSNYRIIDRKRAAEWKEMFGVYCKDQ